MIGGIIAILVVLVGLVTLLHRRALVPWRQTTPAWERRTLEAIANARTMKDVKKLIGRPADTHRDLYGHRGPRFPQRAKADRLVSYFWVLPHTYTEVFADQAGRFYGYTIIGIKHGLGAIDVAGMTVELGRTTWTEAWARSGRLRPEFIVDPGNRSWCGVESSRPDGSTTGRTWAVGNLNVGIGERSLTPTSKERSDAGLAMFNAMQGSEDFHDAPQDWETDSDTLAWRSVTVVNMVAYARSGDMRIEMVNLHDQELKGLDPTRTFGPARRRWPRRGTK